MNHPSIDMIQIVAKAFDRIGEQVLFVGGSVVPLYVPEYSWGQVRTTNDVDSVVEVTSFRDYSRLERKLERGGFSHDMRNGAPICRWLYGDIVVDIMPEEETILGFSNRWYKEGGDVAQTIVIKENCPIRILPRAYFLASKIDAFRSRGNGDYLYSADIEDIVTVLDGCGEQELVEILQAPDSVRSFLASEFSIFVSDDNFLQCIVGHVEQGPTNSSRVVSVIKKVHAIAKLQHALFSS